MTYVKALTLWQPWASLWLTDEKLHETRPRNFKYRGLLLVHAAKKIVTAVDDELNAICVRMFGADWRDTLPTGAIIGKLCVVRCTPVSEMVRPESGDYTCGNWSDGRYAIEGTFKQVFEDPVPWSGQQGCPFNIPRNTVAAALRQCA